MKNILFSSLFFLLLTTSPEAGDRFGTKWDQEERNSLQVLKPAADIDIVDLSEKNTQIGSISFPNMTTIFGDYSALNNMNQILCDATAGDVDIHIISASENKGRTWNLKKIDLSGNCCNIDPAGVETIDGIALRCISIQWENLTFFSDNSNLLIR